MSDFPKKQIQENFMKMHEHFENKIIENLFYCSLLHKNKFLHLQHNFVRQFKGDLVHFVHLP